MYFMHFSRSVCLRYYGRIGMNGMSPENIYPSIAPKKYCEIIERDLKERKFTRLHITYANADHLIYRTPSSNLPAAIKYFLMFLIDQYFVLGIPKVEHLDEAELLLNSIKNKIKTGKIPELIYSNKFYELIPHQGDNQNRKRFRTNRFCNKKLSLIRKMRLIASKLNEASDSACHNNKNPIDVFLQDWLNIEVRMVNPKSDVFRVLEQVAYNTQHANSSPGFSVKKIFKILNSNAHRVFNETMENHQYLIYFTFPSNLLCVLRDGVEPESNFNFTLNRTLKKGIYFSDAVANAGLNYDSFDTVYIAICRVALGKRQIIDTKTENIEIDKSFDSVFGFGNEYASSSSNQIKLNGVMINCGKVKEKIDAPKWFLYNEYAIHSKTQAKIEYILHLERNNNEEEEEEE